MGLVILVSLASYYAAYPYMLGPVYMKVGDPQIGEVTRGGSPHLSCKRDQIKMRDYVDRRVTHQSGLPHLPGVPHLHVNRLLEELSRQTLSKTKSAKRMWCNQTLQLQQK